MTKKLLSIFVLLFFFFSCSIEKKTSTLDLALEDVKIKPQIFYVATNSIIRVTGKKGTTLLINPDNIDFQNGEIPKKIRVELIELTTTEELVRHNVQTLSNGKWLISGGSFKISLFDENTPLTLKEEKNISAIFPKIRNEKMQLFYGDRTAEGVMNWDATDQFFEEQSYFGILKTRLITVDEERNSRFGITRGYYLEDLVLDTLGYSDLESHQRFFEEKEVDTVFISQDTIMGHLLIAPPDLRLADFDIIGDNFNSTIELVEADPILYNFYQTISINKLGWINIDCFYPEIINRVTCEIILNMPLEQEVLYAIDKSNNTILNILPDRKGKYSIDLPENTEFSILAIGSKSKELFASIQSVSISDSKVLEMNMKNVNEKTDLTDVFK